MHAFLNIIVQPRFVLIETTPNITLMNMGQDNLTSVDIKAYLNGNLESTTNWMGNLGLFDF